MQYGIANPRSLAEGMGEAVARRTVLRKKRIDGTPYTKEDYKNNKPFRWESWGELAKRVAEGSMSIINKRSLSKKSQKINLTEQTRFQEHISNGSILMSGRHLQHGDEDQHERNIEVFSNCSTASTSFMKFYLLLNGSGVGRCYDDDLMVVNWSKQPYIHVVLDETHKDYDFTRMESLKQVIHKYADRDLIIFPVQDSREGWAKAVEHLESLIYNGGHENDIVVYDFTKVRPKGSLIGGMQLRPSSGPVPTMDALMKIKSLKGCRMPIWRQTLYVDHYLAESVLVGGARRSARIAVKSWRDPDILDFINIKTPYRIPDIVEDGKVVRKGMKVVPLWSANDSIGVDDDFWAEHLVLGTWANKVFEAACNAAYHHGTGEPGFVNLHKLEVKRDNLFTEKRKIGSKRYELNHGFRLVDRMLKIISTKKWVMIPNPCGEITLLMHGGYCVIGDVALYHCDSKSECEEAVRLTARALIRTNMLDSIYSEETKRTNRIGVSLTGIHEFAWKFFRANFFDMINRTEKGENFWQFITHLSWCVRDEAVKCAQEYGVEIPHTCLTIKPAGTTSKLFGLTEGAHLPSMREYLRWVQFRSDSDLVQKYKDRGYSVRELVQYKGTSIVGFPTRPEICKMGMDVVITAPEATMVQQFKWLMLLEKYWLHSGRENCDYGNQVSYTLKYKRDVISYEQYKNMISCNMPDVKCCAVMPTETDIDDSDYEYLPEEPVSLNQFNEYVSNIKQQIEEDIDKVHIDCAGGACPVDFTKDI